MMKKRVHYIIAALWTLVMAACSTKPENAVPTGCLPEIFPDYIGVTVPATIAPLNFNVMDETEAVYVTVRGANGDEITGHGSWAKFDIEEWHQLLEANIGKDLSFTVYVKEGETGQGRTSSQSRAKRWLRYDDFKVYVSEYPLDEWGLTYRRIAPGYEVYSKMGIYQRDLSNYKEYPIIENTQTSGQCYNCHTPNRTDPGQFVLHVRGEKGATMIKHGGECTWLEAVNDSLGGAMVYPYWHPSGRYCAFSTNQTRQGFHVGGEKRLEVFDYSSDILVYDIDKREIILDPITSTPDWSENTPVFAPDGRSLYFTTCLQRSYPLEYEDELYNLCRISFDPETGKLGERVDTIFDAVSMGKSVTWPRPSYDGRYLLFTLQDYGYFSIWHPESEQWLLDLTTGEARPIDEINSDNADSYHNWNVNSHWVVFTSRRVDGLYTRLYLTSVNDRGEFTKPFMLPQYNPLEYYDASLYSFNTPDFTARKVDLDSHAAAKAILSGERQKAHIR